jgi:hypothetical protein
MPIGLNHETETARPGIDSITEVGSIYGTARSTVPSGYLLCDGSTISRTAYSRLFSAIGVTYGVGDGSTTFTIPDLRGAVPRGAGTSSGYAQNVTSILGTKQDDAFQSFRVHLESWSAETGDGVGNPRNQGYGLNGPYGDEIASTGRFTAHGSNGIPRNSNETRMKNQAVNFFIKF